MTIKNPPPDPIKNRVPVSLDFITFSPSFETSNQCYEGREMRDRAAMVF